jgi:1-acyl-sn-glycerol-3-phosphate acyltransferase
MRHAATRAVGAADDRIAQCLIAETEALLADLGVPQQVSLDDDVECELGLGSIECAELLVRLERALGIPLLERLLGSAHRLHDIHTAIEGRAATPIASSLRPVRATGLPASSSPSALEHHPFPGSVRLQADFVGPATAGHYEKSDNASVIARAARALRRRYVALAAVPILVLGSVIVWAFCRRRDAAARVARATARLAASVAGLRPRLEGLPLPDRPAVLISNHASWLDALILIAAFDRPITLTPKAALFGVPILGTVLRRLGYVPVARGRADLRLGSYQEMRDAAARGDFVHVFPEGTITPQSGVRPFRLGAFRLAAECGVPIVPIAIGGSRAALRDGEWWPSPEPIVVTVLEAIPTPPDDSPAQISAIRDYARTLFARAVNEPLLTVPHRSAGL